MDSETVDYENILVESANEMHLECIDADPYWVERHIKTEDSFIASEYLTSNDDAIESLSEKLLSKLNLKKDRFRTLKTVLVNLYIAAINNFNVSISRTKNHYSFSETWWSYRKVIDCLDMLDSHGLILQVTGKQRFGFQTRISPTEKLIDLFPDDADYQFAAPTNPVILRDKKRQKVNYKKTKAVEEKVRKLRLYNSTIENYNIEIKREIPSSFSLYSLPIPHWIKINDIYRLQSKYFERIFNRTWFRGGRFYNIVQSVPSKIRPYLTINQKPIVELDYSSIHMNLLYNRLNLDLPVEGYEIEGFSREQAKFAFIIIINAHSKINAIAAIQKKCKFSEQDSIKLIFLIEQKNKPIAKYFYKNAGLDLQRRDSKIASGILDSFVRLNRPIIPIHDSFIVQEKDSKLLLDSMQQEYHKVTGFYPKIH